MIDELAQQPHIAEHMGGMMRQPTPGGTGGNGFTVSPDELEQSGRTAQQTAETIPGETSGVLSASDQAETGLNGWRTGSELSACTDEWKRVLDGLSREMSSQGDKLIQTAANYRKGEENAHQSLLPADPNVRTLRGPTLTSVGAPGRATPVGERLLRSAFDGPQVTTQPHRLTSEESERFRSAFDPPAPNGVPVPGRDPRLDFKVHHVEQTVDPDSFDLNAPVRGL
ncbi:hypothetical protein OU787_18020 [Kitasatospora sp. YST-16]|uniref:hypothetical protein n=1 Tax=Kitasatospora sp. YST-16 TaxID=2998080 RepID=UPI0022852F79|nr:hypothetical protein [Kitasatospora sp. YST-16]WAL73238.1 hypothetical protein OU787_18020 [Kitasatospora sp. YST-16]WNW39292.1 hypothetical protein RKE32_17980 [Streptomyces sp. Li-HN-5-13]